MVFDERELRRIFKPKRDEVEGGWKELHNEELHNLYTTPDIITIMKPTMRWSGHVARMAEMGKEYRMLVVKPEGKELKDLRADIRLLLKLISHHNHGG
jgi:hypothetical protein